MTRFSGSDPFILADEYLDWILGELGFIPHVEVVRIGLLELRVG